MSLQALIFSSGSSRSWEKRDVRERRLPNLGFWVGNRFPSISSAIPLILALAPALLLACPGVVTRSHSCLALLMASVSWCPTDKDEAGGFPWWSWTLRPCRTVFRRSKLLSSTQAAELGKAEVTLPWFCSVSEGPYRYHFCRSSLCFGHASILAISICFLDQTDLLLFLSS